MKHTLRNEAPTAVLRRWQFRSRLLKQFTRGLLSAFLRRWHGGAFRVIYWDGAEEQVGDGEPRFCLRVHDPRVFWAVLRAIDVGFGEAYMDRRVEVDDLDAVLELALAQEEIALPQLPRLRPRRERTSIRRQYREVQHHYDRGTPFSPSGWTSRAPIPAPTSRARTPASRKPSRPRGGTSCGSCSFSPGRRSSISGAAGAPCSSTRRGSTVSALTGSLSASSSIR